MSKLRLGPQARQWSSPGQSTWGWQVIGALALTLAAGVLVNWSLASFYGVDIFASIAFPGNDTSWCDTTKYAYGLHCWSDFTLIRFDSIFAYPATYQSATVGVEQTYPLSTRIPRIPFFVVEELFGFRAALLTFLAVITACLFAPAVWATTGSPWHERAIFLLVGTVATAPFLVVWDRGNIFAFVVPLLLVALVAIVRDRPWVVVAATIAAAMVKPQYGALGLVLVALRYWLPALIALGGSALAVFLPFLLVGKQAFNAATAWIDAASALNQRLPLTADLPQNISFARLLVRMITVVAQGGEFVGLDMDGVRSLLGAPASTWTAISLAFVAIVLGALLLAGPRIDRVMLSVTFIAVISLAPTLAYAYYFCFCIPVLAVVLRPPVEEETSPGRLARSARWLLAAAVVCALTPLLVPIRAIVATGAPQLAGSWLPLVATALFATLSVVVAVSGVRDVLACRGERAATTRT